METYGYIPDISPEQAKELDKLNTMYKFICIDLTTDEVEKVLLEYLKDNLDLNLRLLDCTLNFDLVESDNIISYWEILNVSINQNNESYEEMKYVEKTINDYFGKNAMHEISDGEYQLSSKKIFRMIFENAYPKPTSTGYALTVSYDNVKDFIDSPACRYIL